MAEDFGSLLARFRRRAGVSQLALANAAGLHGSAVNRYELGARVNPERASVLALARVLRLAIAETDVLMASAGYLPPSIQRLGPADTTLRAVLGILNDDALCPESRADFRAIVSTMALRWQDAALARPYARRAG